MVLSEPALGFYSIGFGNIPFQMLSKVASDEHIPFLHLRGGARGYNLAQLSEFELERFRKAFEGVVKITLVTTDIDIQDFLADGTERRKVVKELRRLSHAAEYLGAQAIRLMGRRALGQSEWLAVKHEIAASGCMPLVIELHDKSWFQEEKILCLLDFCLSWNMGVLLDSQQITLATMKEDCRGLRNALRKIRPIVKAIHLSDSGYGLAAPGNCLVASVARQAKQSAPIEHAFEWTGEDRSLKAALAAYGRAFEYWQKAIKD